MYSHRTYALLQSRLASSAQDKAIQNKLLAVAASIILLPGSATALTLSEITVHSAIGQPFSASTTATIAKGERLVPGCVQSVNPNGKLGSANNLQIQVPAAAQPGSYTLRITSSAALHEPMFEIRMQANCPETVAVARNYLVLLGISGATPATQPEQIVDQTTATASQTEPLILPSDNPAAIPMFVQTGRVLDPDGATIAGGERYRVRNGDTLSSIASRVSDQATRQTSLVAAAIFRANPGAFVAANPELIKLGSVITIPAPGLALTPATPASPGAPATADAPVVVTNSIPVLVSDEASDQTISNADTAAAEDTITDSPTRENTDAAAEIAQAEAAIAQTKAEIAQTELRIVQAEASIARAGAASTTVSTPAQITDATEASANAAATAVMPQASNPPAAEQTGINGFLAILIGALVGLIFTALLLGKRLLSRFRPVTSEEAEAANFAAAAPSESSAIFEGNLTEPEPAELVDEVASDTRELASTVDIDFDPAGVADSEATANSDTPAHTPRVSLHPQAYTDDVNEAGDSSIENTQFFVAPPFEAGANGNTDFDGGSTMGELFSELDDAAPISDDAATQEIPDLLISDDAATQEIPDLLISDDAATQEIPDLLISDAAATQELPDLRISDDVATQELPDLQSLTEHADAGELDEQMSETLTQTMGLLSDDYEDELTNSQILDAKEVASALSEHAEAEKD
jgi:phage tail protein X